LEHESNFTQTTKVYLIIDCFWIDKPRNQVRNYLWTHRFN